MTSTNGETTVEPITIENLLLVTGTTGTAKDLRYYFDEDSNSGDGGFVIAPKSIAESGSGTPIATVLAFASNGDAWVSNKGIYRAGAGITGLNNNLSGSQFTTAHTKTTINFILYGQLNGIPTLMRGTLLDGNRSR